METRGDILVRHGVYKQLESDVVNAKALHAELCDRLALLTAPVELLSKAEVDVASSQIQVDRFHQVRDRSTDLLTMKRTEALMRKQSCERHRLVDHNSVADDVAVVHPGVDARDITVFQPSGRELVVQVFEGDQMKTLKGRLAETLGISLDRFRLKLVSDDTLIEDDDVCVVQCQSQYFTLILEKLTVIKEHGPTFPDFYKYEATGVVGQDGCI